MTITFLRLFFIFLSCIVGYYIGSLLSGFSVKGSYMGASLGGFISLMIILLELGMKRLSIRNLSAAVFGLIFGFFMAWIVTSVLRLIPMSLELFSSLQIILILIFCYLGMVIAIRGKDEFNLIIPYIKFVRQDKKDDVILLDTSVIIDGRVADMLHTKFIEGRLVIPRFILRELQQIADSQDALKRNRGRRGLDILNKLQKSPEFDVHIQEDDFPDVREVDAKLVKIAKLLGGKVLTNDFNLNKVAELQGVTVLNINELANALRPVVLPGEVMDVRISKEGKEHNQGIAYLDDGTMIVIDNSRHLISQSVNVVVTSVLQTSAGRMIFAKLEDPGGHGGGKQR
ncbi:MAG: TRAM domain-containing protein [Candidatus Omnitrophica bacterium]|nr:TRAM domain-containing protein [Candidatus Omnitrophota bacterium]MBU0881285.1 TRAM domain-containing protein [Candidatus Omnitrophota bacterium]MBU0895482.1 TRAM domain-containing protein [Candidatus Omnitrophota bacterium]MBU1038046.1 TRAM domain-containing protein [Candidatus Omnitrophota bacterium]MBU1808738.1 TRAM domain-containing protein [Candidatus Omnitrophota bacterium]